MNFTNKLSDTYQLLKKFDDLIMNQNDKGKLKKHLLSISDDLTRYKYIDEKSIKFENNEVISKINDILKKIVEIEKNVKNKVILTEKYTSYLNS